MDSVIRHSPASFGQAVSKVAGVKAPKTRKIISLFSGCGGMDLGFVGGFEFGGRTYDRLPFDVIWANDLDIRACKTYRQNLQHDIHCGNVHDYLDTLPRHADILIGGFPCQDVSINGNRKANKGLRSTLYRTMQEAISITKPHIFVAENVKGILMEHSKVLYAEMMQGFDALGYNVTMQVYLAADYGVPQMRERVIFVGTRKTKPTFEHPAPVFSKSKWVTAEDALQDLEKRDHDKAWSHIWSQAKASADQGQRVLIASRPSTTIRAECHGNQQFHYKLPRRLSLREAARLQSFPDNFIFPDGMRVTERQIGNAVPPVLAWHIACAVRDYLT